MTIKRKARSRIADKRPRLLHDSFQALPDSPEALQDSSEVFRYSAVAMTRLKNFQQAYRDSFVAVASTFGCDSLEQVKARYSMHELCSRMEFYYTDGWVRLENLMEAYTPDVHSPEKLELFERVVHICRVGTEVRTAADFDPSDALITPLELLIAQLRENRLIRLDRRGTPQAGKVQESMREIMVA